MSSYYYPPTVRGPLDALDDLEARDDMHMCDDCGGYTRTDQLWRHSQDRGCPAFDGAAGYDRATLYAEFPPAPAGVTTRYAQQWNAARTRDMESGR